MSTTTKSPKKVAVAAFRSAARTLPRYAHRFSPKKFTQPQLFACLVLKTLFKTDYRGIVTILSDCSDLTRAIDLKTVPHYTTLHKASQRLLTSEHVQKLLETTIKLLLKNRIIVKLAALDATGLESGHISPYFYKVRSNGFKNRKWTHFTRWPKAAVVGDTFGHSILAILTTRGPGRDSTHFKDILSRLPKHIKVEHMVADAGYDAEANHIYANEVMGIKATIPPKVGRAPKHLPKTPYRRQMKLHFNSKAYRQRWQVETIFSMIKRNLGYCLYGKSQHSQNSEMFLPALTHNIMLILFFYLSKSFSTKQD